MLHARYSFNELLVLFLHGFVVRSEELDSGIICLCKRCRELILPGVVLFGVLLQARCVLATEMRPVTLVNYISDQELLQVPGICSAQALLLVTPLLSGEAASLLAAVP